MGNLKLQNEYTNNKEMLKITEQTVSGRQIKTSKQTQESGRKEINGN